MIARLVTGVLLCGLPILLALTLLVAGASRQGLVLVYALIAVSLLAVPAFVVGALPIVRSARGRTGVSGPVAGR